MLKEDHAGSCELCGKLHQWREQRYRCTECKQVLCLYQVHNGKHWHRRGEGVHLVITKRGGGIPDCTRLCGVVEPIAIEEVMDGSGTVT